MDRQAHRKGAPPTRTLGGRRNLSAVQLDQALGQAEAEPGALGRLDERILQLGKGLEKLGEVLGLHPDPAPVARVIKEGRGIMESLISLLAAGGQRIASSWPSCD